jgi:predicted nucleic acid-binding protein
MTVAYFDASALVKLLIDEHGSDDAALLWDGADEVITSRISSPEVRAALATARRIGRLDDRDHRRTRTDWARFRRRLRVVELTYELEARAGELTDVHPLSGCDAIHLASALTIAAETSMVLATWDGRLLTAGQSAGLVTLPRSL